MVKLRTSYSSIILVEPMARPGPEPVYGRMCVSPPDNLAVFRKEEAL